MEERKEMIIEEETTMCWNETCEDCYYYNPSESTCTYNGNNNPTRYDKPKCSNYRG